MILYKVICISSVFLFISHGSTGYQESLWVYHNNTVGGYREAGYGSNSSASGSDQNLGQDGYVFNAFPGFGSRSVAVDPRALILTPYLKDKKFQEGIEAAKVTPFVADIESYSGFFEVNQNHKSYMFFWYFPPLNEEYVGKPDTPVILWLQGGMGESGLFGAFRENGPIHLEPNGKMIFNEWSWAERAHLVYFDSPVGAGYSFTKSGKYPTNQNEVAEDLYTALRQFLRLFQLTENPFFIAGQAYAGKTISALGAMIHKGKKAFPVNFQGVAIGNGFVDPPNMLEYGKFLYQLGFIDDEAREELHEARDKIIAALGKNMEKEAIKIYTKYIQRGPKMDFPFIDWVTAIVSKLKFTKISRGVNEEKLLGEYLNIDSIQGAFHTTGTFFVKNNFEVLKAIWPDLLKSQVHNLKLLMNHYRVLLYNGQMSIKNAYPLVLEYLRKIRWRGGKRYRQAKRKHWKVDGELAGYFKTGGRFTELLIRNAGCHVPADQPKWAQRMINNFIFGKNLNDK